MLATIALPEGVTLTAAGEQVPLLALDLLTRWKALDLIGDDRVETDDVLADWFASVGVDPSLPMRHWVNRPNNDYVDEDPLTAAAGDGDAEDGHAGGGHAGEAVAAAAADGPPLDGVLDAPGADRLRVVPAGRRARPGVAELRRHDLRHDRAGRVPGPRRRPAAGRGRTAPGHPP
jgi:hypothetical protein